MQHDTVRDRKSLVQPVNLNYRYAIAKRLKLTTGYFDTWRRGITHVGHLNGHTLAAILGIIDNVVQVAAATDDDAPLVARRWQQDRIPYTGANQFHAGNATSDSEPRKSRKAANRI